MTVDPAPGDAELARLLHEVFGHREFREGQLEAIRAVLDGRDVVAVMPTGGGKSLLYQLPAIARSGLTLVVSPLIALMKDQVDALRARGIRASFLNSTLGPGEQDERIEQARRGELRLLYLAPERFRNERFRAAAPALGVTHLAVDEAHCISEWGHDFRPDYRRIGEALELLGRPPVIALTATATPEVRADIVRELGLADPLILVSGFDRKNLFLQVVQTRSDEQKREVAARTIDEAGGAGIVYAASRKSAEKIALWLEGTRRKAGLYHAGLDDAARSRVQERFMSGELPIIVATNAFGMGIDKSDIRFVLHWEFPKSLEAYYQEVGRAGRDGKPARAVLLFSYPDKRIQDFFIEAANPQIDLVRRVWRAILARAEAPQPWGAPELAADLGLRHDMAVASCLAILERAGAIVREARAPGEGRARAIRIVEAMPAEKLPVDGAALARKLRADQDKLEAVLQFAYATSCRKERLLRYFGDARRSFHCAACDRCLRSEEETRALDETEQATAMVCLECVAALDGKLGRFKMAEILAGASCDVVERWGLDELPALGKLRHLGTHGVLGWIDALLDRGYLEKQELDREGAYVLKLSRAGKKALREDGEIRLAPPERVTQRRVSRGGRTEGRRPAASGRGPEPEPPPLAAAPAAAPDPVLLLKLKQWRRKEARQRAVPAYVVFPDQVLAAIASARPRSAEELANISGVGPRKLESYGEAVLDLVRAAAP